MPTNTKIRDALTAPVSDVNVAMLEAIEERYAYVIKAGENPSEVIPGFTHSVIYNGVVFTRDDSDSTTPSDGTFCVVLNGGVRYKSTTLGNGPAVRRFAVTSILATPPASPVVGAAYIVGTGATGEWAAKDGQVAVWTLAGWRFIVPKAYDEAHVSALSQVYHYNASSIWVSGVAAFSFINNSVSFSKLKHGLGQAVESLSLNTPPVSPSEGVSYIVGGSPTGAWTGQAFKLAIYENSSWVFYEPSQGWVVMNKQNGTQVVYNSTGWTSTVSGYSSITQSAGRTAASGVVFQQGAQAYLVLQQNYTPKRANSIVEIELSGITSYAGTTSSLIIADGYVVNFSVDSGPVLESFRGQTITENVPTTQFFGSYLWTAPDTATHTLKFYASTQNNIVFGQFGSARIIIRERA